MTFPLTPTIIVLGPTAVDTNARTGTALPINLSNLQCRPLPPQRLTQSPRIALDRRPRVQTNRLGLARANPGPTSATNEPLPLSP
jgi:hypothetical protein